MVTRHADAGRHKKVARGQNRLDNYCSGDLELRVAGPGSAYVSIGLLLERDKNAAAKRDPSNVHRYVEASRRGQCVVTDEKDKLHFRCISARHRDQQPHEFVMTHKQFFTIEWGCKACADAGKGISKEDVQRRLEAAGLGDYKVVEWLGKRGIATVDCPDHGPSDIPGQLVLAPTRYPPPCHKCKQAASRATSWEEKAVIRTVTLEMGIPPSDVKAAAGAVTKDGCQMDIGPYRADGYVELRASRAPDGSIVQLILESNGANWHGDAREPQYEGIDFYMRLVFGATGCERFVRTIKRRRVLAAMGYTIVEIWPRDGIKAIGMVGSPRGKVNQRLAQLFQERPQLPRIIIAARAGVGSQAYDDAVAELTSADVTWEDVLGEEEYLARTWEEGEFLVIKSEDDVLLSGPWAPYPLDQVKHLDDNVDKYLGKMGDDQAAWMKVLQEVLKAIVAEPERTIASLQAMLIAAPPVAQEASDVPSTPEKQPLAGEEVDLVPYMASPGVHAALEQAAATGVSVPLQSMFGISVTAADAATPTKLPAVAATDEGAEPGAAGAASQMTFEGGPTGKQQAAQAATWASPQRGSGSKQPPKKTRKRAPAEPAATQADAPMAAASSAPSGTIASWLQAAGSAQGAASVAAGRGGGSATRVRQPKGSRIKRALEEAKSMNLLKYIKVEKVKKTKKKGKG